MNCSLARHIVIKTLTLIILMFNGVLFANSTLRDNELNNITNDEKCDSALQFKCLDAACIAIESRCNGIVDCLDSSDEMECCSKNQFFCGPPNHCIDKSNVCNDINDCANNKDEMKCHCVLPNVPPNNTKVFVYNDVLEAAPGTVFNTNDLFIEYNCTDGYTEISESWRTNYCKVGKNGIAEWEHKTFLGCTKTCPKTIFHDDRHNKWQTLKDKNDNWQMCRDENRKTINCRTEPYIFPGTTVQMVCSEDNSLTTQIKCDANGSWTGTYPECYYTDLGVSNSNNNSDVTCSTESLTKASLQLIFNNNFKTFSITSGWGTMNAGAKVKIVCAPEYYSYSEVNTELTCDLNGEWTGGEIPKCTMVCGERSGRYMIPSMSNGIPTSTHIYPWVAALYRKTPPSYEYICGGNIISPKLVISVAHCFTKNTIYLLGVGNKFRHFHHSHLNENVQMHEISDTKYLGAYIGEQTYYQNDIIVIVLTKFIRFDVHIKPVCIDYETESNEIKENLLDLDHGSIAGWGSVENGQLSEELIYTSHPIVDDCRSHLRNNGRLNEINYLTSDKFCAGNFDYSTVCSGDSGHGLVFEKLVNNRLRFYLYGVLSLTAANCSVPSYGFYTNIQSFREEIKNLMVQYAD